MKWPGEKMIRWTGIPLLGFIMSFIVKDHRHEALSFINNVIVSIVFTGVLWNGAFLIIMGLRRKYPKIELTSKRLIITSISMTFFLVFGAVAIRLILGLVSLSELRDPWILLEHAHINMIAAFMVSSIYEGAYFFGEWKKSYALNEQLRNLQIRTQFEVLQNQMSPHFLFNSLNTLTTLIAEDQKTAIDFTQTLSEVYRYILQNKERELVDLAQEIAFSKSYVYLLQMRYPENLEVTFSIDPTYHTRYIAPLTMQMLIENAIKHNVISKSDPLHIEVYMDGDEVLVIKNNLQLKKTVEKSTKTGLANIRKRYEFLGQKNIDVIVSQTHFAVVIPMINMMTEIEYAKTIHHEGIDH